MIAYKFRSSAQIAFAFDIIINKRLYCADWKDLNDPMEGVFAYSHNSNSKYDIEKRVMGITKAKRKYKVCSLSSIYDSHLLWAHYANGFDGVAIELDLPDDDPNVKPVTPRAVFGFLELDKVKDEREAAKMILFSKYEEWSYEKEIRILHHKAFYELKKPIKRVIAGTRVPEALFDVLNITCNSLGIEFGKIGIGDDGLDIDSVPPPQSLAKKTQ